MLLSSDYILRLIGPYEGSKPHDDRQKLTDYQAELTLRRTGSHQHFLDASRCPNLSSHFMNRIIAQCCPNLLHIDVSYSSCNDLNSIFQKCEFLKTLNMSGLTLLETHLKGIEQLHHLEVITMRKSNINDISALEHLYLLRSIDLGYVKLQKIGKAFQQKERLEELVLDYCELEHKELIYDVLQAIVIMPRLKLLNILEGSFAMWQEEIQNTTSNPLYFEKLTRRQLFFEAIINNHYRAMYRYLTSGQYLDDTLGPEDELWVYPIFQSRCIYSKTNLQTPFFLYHKDSKLNHRPNALHLAIFFNSFECIQIVLDQNINRFGEVYCVEVMSDSQQSCRLLEDPNPVKLLTVGLSKTLHAMINSGSKKMKSIDLSTPTNGEEGADGEGGGGNEEVQFDASKKLFTVNELVQLVYQKRIHRLTENMIPKKISNWKDVCETYKKRIEYLLNPSAVVRDGKVLTLDEMKRRKSFAIKLEVDALNTDRPTSATGKHGFRGEPTDVMINIESRPGSTGEMKAGDGIFDPNSTAGRSSSPPKTAPKLKRQVSFAVESKTSTTVDADIESKGEAGENLEIHKAFQTPYGIFPKYGQKAQAQAKAAEDNPEGRSKYSILLKKNRFVNWREQGLVYKISGKPAVLPVSKLVQKGDSSSWMQDTMGADAISGLESGAMTPSRPGTSASSARMSRTGSRASLKRQPSSRKTPTFAPLERLRTLSIKGLTLHSDPNDTPFANLPDSFSRSGKMAKKSEDGDDDDLDFGATGTATSGMNTARSEVSTTSTATITTKKYTVQEIEVLGKKSYWLESKKLAIQEKLQIMEEAYKKEQELYRNTVFKDGRVKRYPRKRDTIEARRLKFIEYLKNRIESKIDALDKDH